MSKITQAIKEEEIPETRDKEFKINEFITLRLEYDEINIYVKGERFEQCKYLLFHIPRDNVKNYDDINSIDDAEDIYSKEMEGSYAGDFDISAEQEFIAHCSNLQAWAENGYDSRLLHRNLAFPLLRKLVNSGDPQAKKIFKDEVSKRIESGNSNVITFLIENDYLEGFSVEELDTLFRELKEDYYTPYIMKAITLIKDFRERNRYERSSFKKDHFVINDGFSSRTSLLVYPKDSVGYVSEKVNVMREIHGWDNFYQFLEYIPKVSFEKRSYYDLTETFRKYNRFKDMEKTFNSRRILFNCRYVEYLKRFTDKPDDFRLYFTSKVGYRGRSWMDFYIKLDIEHGRSINVKLGELKGLEFRWKDLAKINRKIREYNNNFDKLLLEYRFLALSNIYDNIADFFIEYNYRNALIDYNISFRYSGQKNLSLNIELTPKKKNLSLCVFNEEWILTNIRKIMESSCDNSRIYYFEYPKITRFKNKIRIRVTIRNAVMGKWTLKMKLTNIKFGKLLKILRMKPKHDLMSMEIVTTKRIDVCKIVDEISSE